MKRTSLHLMAVGAVLLLILGACNLDTADGNQPTPIVITSTPTDTTSDPSQPIPAVTPSPGQPPTAATEALPDPTETPSTPTPASTSAPSDDEARTEIEAIEADVVELRGLDLLEDLDEQIIDRDELARRVQDIIDEDYSEEEARLDSLTYWLLRLIPDASLDLYQLQIDLLSEQIAGYYDPETKELVVVTSDGELKVNDKVTMAHEVVHALQDQHFDLIAIDEFAKDIDHSAAITALIEGDATLAMTDYMLGYLDPLELVELFGESFADTDTSILDTTPRYIADGLLFSYDAGQVFATALYDEGGYAAIDAAYTDPPTSTEQILHPEKYIQPNRDEPILVQNPDVMSELGDGWEVVRGDALGEWDLQIMLEENGIGASEAANAAAGWGGSWYDIYESDSGSVALLTTRWDTSEDASEFADALLASFDGDAEFGAIWHESGRSYSVLSGNDTVVLISGTDSAAVETIQSLIEQTL